MLTLIIKNLTLLNLRYDTLSHVYPAICSGLIEIGSLDKDAKNIFYLMFKFYFILKFKNAIKNLKNLLVKDFWY